MKLTVVLICLITCSAIAHHGPQHQIDALTTRISQKPTAALFTFRASLYIENGNIELAKKDLSKALEMNTDYIPALKLAATLK